jgi:hypothetical protein
MFGITYTCDQCDFGFCSGWSHHAAGQLMVCGNCGRGYVLSGGASCWGTHIGERLQLFAFDGETDVPTGCFTTVREEPTNESELVQTEDGVSHLYLDPLQCPHCSRTDTLRQSFEDGDECPKCHTGQVHLLTAKPMNRR